jgi:hypothetical protein
MARLAYGSRAHFVGHDSHLDEADRKGTGGNPPWSRRPLPSIVAKGGMGAILLMKWTLDI